jgi:hypothetical protein
MTKVSGAKSSPSKPKASSNSGAKQTGKTSKTNSVKNNVSNKTSVQPSERAKDIVRSNEIKDGTFKSRSDATVGDIAQASLMKEKGLDPDSPDTKLDSAEINAKVSDLVKNNEALKKAAQEAGIDLNNPTAEDLEKLSDLAVKGGQEIKTDAEKAKETEEKPAAEAQETEEPQPEESFGGGECGGPQEAGASDDQKQPASIGVVIDLINQAEAAAKRGDANGASEAANKALQMIDELRQKAGNSSTQNNYTKRTNVINKINAPGKLDGKALAKDISSLKGDDLQAVLNTLQSRALRAKNNNTNSTLDALTLTSEQNNVLRQLGLGEIGKLFNKSAA